MPKIQNILVGYDGFDRDEGLPAVANSLAVEHGASLHVTNVLPELPRSIWRAPSVSVKEVHTALIDSRREHLEKLLETARDQGLAGSATIRTGSAHEELIRQAKSIDADLLIVSDEPAGERRGFGSVTTKLLRQCPCPVLATPYKQTEDFHRDVLAAVDVDPIEGGDPGPNRDIVDFGLRLARRGNGRLTLFHAWSMVGEELLRGQLHMNEKEIQRLLGDVEKERKQQLEQLLSEFDVEGVDVQIVLCKGEARWVLHKAVEELGIDLMVIGTACRTGLKGYFVGNTAERLLEYPPCAVLTIKPDGFVSPVEA